MLHETDDVFVCTVEISDAVGGDDNCENNNELKYGEEGYTRLFMTHLMDHVTLHAFTKSIVSGKRCTKNHFYGVMIDTSRANSSTPGMNHYLA